ncbi:unnamed protein product [Withania somnifera]
MERRRAISSRAHEQSQTKTLDCKEEDEIVQLEEEIQQLEEQVHEMAEKIVDYRTTIPAQLKTILHSILATERPLFDTQGPQSQPGCSNHPSTSDVEGCGASLAGEVQKEAEKAQLLKQKITSNASAIPVVMNRMKESMTRIDKLQCSSKVIHPAFKRGRTA